MNDTILCAGCGERVPVPEGYGKRKLRCPDCGVMGEVPPATKAAVTTFRECGQQVPGTARIIPDVLTARSVSLPPIPSVPTLPKLLIDGTDEDDGKPYRIPGDPEQNEPCPQCRKSLPLGAIICNHCGFNRETGATLQRVHEKVNKQWEFGMAFSTRLGIFLVASGLTLVAGLAFGNLVSLALGWIVGTILWAYLLGSYARLTLTRSSKGRVRLMRSWRMCFLPLSPTTIPWGEFGQVAIIKSNHNSSWDWFVMMALLPLGLLPGILWWLFVICLDHFDVVLTKDHGSTLLLVHQGTCETTAKEIATTIRNVSGLL